VLEDVYSGWTAHVCQGDNFRIRFGAQEPPIQEEWIHAVMVYQNGRYLTD
jgi:hypothetical protein